MGDLEPKLVTVLREGYPKGQLLRDLAAGVTVGIVALPLAIAFAIASGVKPEQGLYTAIIAGFLISVLSGSRVQIGGPTGAFIVLVYSVVQQHGYDGLAVATILAGILLVLMGLARLGTLIQFIPYPVTVGFTAGIALIIASGQVRDALGLDMGAVPAGFIEKWAAYAGHLGSVDARAAALCVGTVAIVQLWPRVTRRVPGSLVALVATTIAVHAAGLSVETIGGRFGGVPQSLPVPRWPSIDWARIPSLLSPAVSIALLAGIESLLAAVVADGMTGRRHRSNMELVAQGVANIASPLFGGIPATGAIARTATNVKSGGRTPVAGIIHAATLLVILAVAGRWAALVPMATLAGVLLVVAYNMSEAHLFAKVLRGPRGDALVLVVTFLLTVAVDLIVAIQVGVVLASLLFMQRMAEATEVRSLPDLLDEEEHAEDRIVRRELPAGVEVFEVTGPFFFGAASKFSGTLGAVSDPPKVLILRLRHVPIVDATGLRALEDLEARCRRDGTRLILSGVQESASRILARAGVLERVGSENVVDGLKSALARARELVGAAG